MPFAFKVIPRLLLCVAHRYQCMKRLWWGRGQQQNIFSYLKVNISPLFGVRNEFCLDVLMLVDPDEIQSAYRGFI